MNYTVDATDVPLSAVLSQHKSHFEEVEYDEYDQVVPSTPGMYSIEVANTESETEATANAVVKVIEQYNKEFGIQLPTKLDDIKELITMIASREARDLYVVALSEAADRIILGTVTSTLITVSSLIGQLTSDASINGMTLVEKVGVLDRLMQYLTQLLEIQGKLGIDNPRLAMKSAMRKNKDSSSGTKESMNIKEIDTIISELKTRT